MNAKAYVAVLAILTSGCGAMRSTNSAGAATEAGSPDSVLLSVRSTKAHLVRSATNKQSDSLRVVIRDSETFAAFWRRSDFELRVPPASLPQVDFRPSDVIVAALGNSLGGSQLAIDSVLVRGDERIVVVRRRYLPEWCNMPMNLDDGRPVDVVVVPRDTVRRTVFVERVAVRRTCSDVDPPVRDHGRG